jgi:hypothetical protein
VTRAWARLHATPLVNIGDDGSEIGLRRVGLVSSVDHAIDRRREDTVRSANGRILVLVGSYKLLMRRRNRLDEELVEL